MKGCCNIMFKYYVPKMCSVHLRKNNVLILHFLTFVSFRSRVVAQLVERWINNNNNCLKSNIQCIEIRVQWTVHLGSSHMHVHAVTRVHAVTPKLVICVMYLTSI